VTAHAHWHDVICAELICISYAGATSPARFCVLRTIQFSRTEPKTQTDSLPSSLSSFDSRPNGPHRFRDVVTGFRCEGG
jgi:hypothetical protein